jgi:hypothetical protein
VFIWIVLFMVGPTAGRQLVTAGQYSCSQSEDGRDPQLLSLEMYNEKYFETTYKVVYINILVQFTKFTSEHSRQFCFNSCSINPSVRMSEVKIFTFYKKSACK